MTALPNAEVTPRLSATNRLRSSGYRVCTTSSRTPLAFTQLRMISSSSSRDGHNLDDQRGDKRAVKILVTGAAGMLGSALVSELIRAGHDVSVTDIDTSQARPWGKAGPTLRHLDVRSAQGVSEACRGVRPDFVVHLAAETNLEVCEQDPDGAYHTNALGTKNVALACRANAIPLAYVSTAGVFDGEKETAYIEFDDPNPINVYGRSKYEGERFVSHLLDRYYTVRAGWMVGGGAKDHKFVAKIVDQLRRGQRVIHAVSDKLGTPTYAPDFARCFSLLVETGSYGLYHMACRGEGSRYDVAARILEVLGRDDVELREVESAFFKDEFFAPRPRSEIMRNLVLELQGMNTMRPWRTALEEYLRNEFPDMAAQPAHRGE